MSDATLALLLLPDPPQRLANLDDIRAALYPPIDAAVSFLDRKTTDSVLEIALPISRLVHVFRQHRSLFANVSVLLANVYSLLSVIYQEKNLPLSGAAHVDTRIILISDDSRHFTDPQTLPCGTVQFTTLAQCKRAWTHIFTVDGEDGQAKYRVFRSIAAQERPAWHPRTVHIAGGLQFHFPDKVFDAETSANTLVHSPISSDTLIAINARDFDFTDKYTLTMGLFSVGPLPKHHTGDTSPSRGAGERRIYIATVGEDSRPNIDDQIDQQRKIIDFLVALLDFGEPKAVATYASKADTLNASPPLSSIEQRFRIQCIVNGPGYGLTDENAGLTTMVVANRNYHSADLINKLRRTRSWEELIIVRVNDVERVDLAVAI